MESYHLRIDRVTQGPDGLEQPANRLTIDSHDFLWIYVDAGLPASATPQGEYLRVINGKPDPGTRVQLDPPYKVGGHYRFSVYHYTLAEEAQYSFHFADRLNQPTYQDTWEIDTIPASALTQLVKARGSDVTLKADIHDARIEFAISGLGSRGGPATYFDKAANESIRNALQFAAAMERIAPPRPRVDRAGPTEGAVVTQPPMDPANPVTLSAVPQYWTKSCKGSDSFENNCAHFLSDAMIRTGFVQLKPPTDCVNARCATTSKRPIRARDMWCWFKSMASKTSDMPTKNTGMWAVFQLNEEEYWGGHVVVLDSDNWKYYGTAWYGDWEQHLYQW